MDVSFKQKCIELRKQDYTLNEIVGILGRSKTSVYFHIKDIPLSAQKQNQITTNNIKRCVQNARNKKGASVFPFQQIRCWDKNSVSLVAHLLFDGEIRNTSCAYHNRSKVLIDHVKATLTPLYLREIKERHREESGVISLLCCNAAFATHIKMRSKDLIEEIPYMHKDLQRSFLQAFYDDEGCIDFNRGVKRVRGYQHNTEMLLLVAKLLLNFGIQAKVDKKYNEIIVSRKENLEKFAKEINFSPGVKVNGKRTNSIWKKDLEKREILQMALDSYQN